MARDEIDTYLAELDEPKRSTLEALRRSILAVIPDAEEGISYGLPAFRVQGKAVAGFAAHAAHLGYMPHSGSVVASLGDVLAGYETTKGSVKFPVDQPLPDDVVEALVRARLDELGLDGD